MIDNSKKGGTILTVTTFQTEQEAIAFVALSIRDTASAVHGPSPRVYTNPVTNRTLHYYEVTVRRFLPRYNYLRML